MSVHPWLVWFAISVVTTLAWYPPVSSTLLPHTAAPDWCNEVMVSSRNLDSQCQSVVLVLHSPSGHTARQLTRRFSAYVQFTLERVLKAAWNKLIYGISRRTPTVYETHGKMLVTIFSRGAGNAVGRKTVPRPGFHWFVVFVSCPAYGDLPYWASFTLDALRHAPQLFRSKYAFLYGPAFFDSASVFSVPEFERWIAQERTSLSAATGMKPFDVLYHNASDACPEWSSMALAGTGDKETADGGSGANPSSSSPESDPSLSGAGPLPVASRGNLSEPVSPAVLRPSAHGSPSQGDGVMRTSASTAASEPSSPAAARGASTAGDGRGDSASAGDSASEVVYTTAMPLTAAVVAVTMVIVALTVRYHLRRVATSHARKRAAPIGHDGASDGGSLGVFL